MKAVEATMASVALAGGDDDSDEDADSPFGQLRNWIRENREDIGPVEVYKKAEELGIAKKHNTMVVLGQALFTENVVAEIPKFAPLFVKVRGPVAAGLDDVVDLIWVCRW